LNPSLCLLIIFQTSTIERPIVNGKQEPAQLKIEVPANRSVQKRKYKTDYG
jgi:hypothetical protein